MNTTPPVDPAHTSNAQELQRRLDANPDKRGMFIQEFYAERLAAGDREGADYAVLLMRIELEKENARLRHEQEIMKLEQEKSDLEQKNKQPPKWLPIAGLGFGCITFLFLGAIVIAAIVGYVVPPAGKFALVAMMAFGAAFAAAAWIGNATLSGSVAPDSQKPLILSASGGFAIFALVFFFGYWFYIK